MTVQYLLRCLQTVPYISSVLEQPISMFGKSETADAGVVARAEECFELPPIQHLPADIPDNVLESIGNEFRGKFMDGYRRCSHSRLLNYYDDSTTKSWPPIQDDAICLGHV